MVSGWVHRLILLALLVKLKTDYRDDFLSYEDAVITTRLVMADLPQPGRGPPLVVQHPFIFDIPLSKTYYLSAEHTQVKTR